MLAGDTHGNTAFVTHYLYPTAVCLGVDHIIQVGDFGYWEHKPPGVRYLDVLDQAAVRSQIPLYWLHGNHDNHALALAKYKRRTIEGFVPVRSHVFYIPQGASWMWEDGVVKPYARDNAGAITARAFGGAYSIDKAWRLDHERERNDPGSLWFPEEEMTDQEMAHLLAADSDPRTIVFSHDKPRSSNPGLPLKDMPECHFNQDRLQRALLAHTPSFWVHGHLHYRYADRVRSGDDSTTAVIGLGCDDLAADRFQKPWHAWAVLEIDGPEVEMHFGDSALLDIDDVAFAKAQEFLDLDDLPA